MTHYEYAAGMIDDAISQARFLITLWDDDGTQTCDGWYVQIREFLEDALEAISPPNNESSEPWSAIEWALAHMPLPEKLEGPTFSDGGYSRPLDERAERQPTTRGRVRWLVETQQDRLMAAAARLRVLAAMMPLEALGPEVERGWTWAELRARLMDIPGMTASNAANKKRNGKLVELAPEVYTRASCEALLQRLSSPRKGRATREEYDPLNVEDVK
jgi:hypothetical protein